MPLADFFMLSKDQILQKAEKLRAEGKHAKAAELLASGLKNTADDFELLTALASAHLAERKGRDASLALKNALSLVPSRSAEILELAERYFFSEGQLPEMGDLAFELNIARRNLEAAFKIIKDLPDRDVDIITARYQKIKDSLDKYSGPPKPAGILAKDMSTYYALTLLLDRRDQVGPAFDLLDKILDTLPTEEDNVLNGSALLASNHPGNTTAILRQADILLRTGRKDKALALYAEAAKSGQSEIVLERLMPWAQTEDKNIPLQQFLTRLYIQQQRPAEALSLVKKLISTDRRNLEIYLGLLQEIAKLDPTSTEIMLTLGDAALEARKFDLAMANFAKVSEREPGRLDEILERYRRIIELAPENEEAAVRIVDAYHSAGRNEQAVASLKEILAHNPALIDLALEKLDEFLKTDLDQPPILSFLAECYLKRQEYAKAAKVYHYLGLLGPNHQDSAIKSLQKVVSRDPRAFEPMYHLMAILLEAEHFQEAAIIGRELSLKHANNWTNFLPLLLSYSDRAGLEYNMSLSSICAELEKSNQDEPAIILAKAIALVHSDQFVPASDILIRLSRNERASTKAVEILEMLSDRYPQAGPLHLALAEIYQHRGETVKMAGKFLAASRVDRSLIPKVSASLQELLEKSPDNAELQLLQLDLLFQQRLWENAFKQANVILLKWPGPEGAKAYLRVGQIYLEKGELTKAAGGLLKAAELDRKLATEAAQSLQRLLEIDSTSLAGRYALGKVLFYQKEYDAAVEELMAVCHRDPKWAEKVAADLKAIQNADPVNRNVLLAEAKINFLLRRTEETVSALSQLIEVSPESFDQALEIYQRLLARDPHQPQVKISLAKALIIQGRTEEGVSLVKESVAADAELAEPAITLLRLSLERNPEDLESGYLLAKLYCQRGGFSQGLDILETILKHRPDQADRLAAELDEIIKLKPDFVPARYLLIEVLLTRRRYPEAIRNLEIILKQQPADRQNVIEILDRLLEQNRNQLEALILRSRLLSLSGQLERAIEGFMRAAEIDADVRPQLLPELERIRTANPNLAKVNEALGIIYFEMGKFPQARDALSQAISLMSDGEDKMRLLFFLAESHLALRNESKAEEAMDQIKAMMPDANEVYKALRRFATRRLQVEIDKAYQAVQEAPDDQFKKLDLASKLLMVEKYDAVIKLLAFKPQDEELARRRLLMLARAFLGRNEAYTAIELLRQVPLIQHPFNRFQMDVCYLLGLAYEAVGNFAGAVTAYRNIYIDQTDFRDVKRRLEYAAEKAVLKELGHRASILEATAAVYD